MRRVYLLPLLTLPLLSSACKDDRAKLEQLVPDGATGLISMDAQALVKSELYAKLKTSLEGIGDAKATLDALRDECKLDPETLRSLIVGFDALSQNAMAAIRMPNLGKADALRCADELAKKNGKESLWTVAEADGKATLSIRDGEVEGWALDDDTLVFSSKGWASAVQARIKGESKGAVDNNLAQAVAMADRSEHVWFAGEVPALVAPFLEGTPGEGVRRVAGSVHYGDTLAITVAAAFSDEAAAKALHDEAVPRIDEAKKAAVAMSLTQQSADSVELELDGAIVRMKASLDIAPLFESSAAALTQYMNRSKTSEARAQLGKVFDGASSYFNEEHVSRDAAALIGAGAAIADVAPHQCPNDGKSAGAAGVTPPLSVDCSKGPGGRCVPVEGEPSGPGEYSMSLWSDNKVWDSLNFQMKQGHYFHYDFRWANNGEGYGDCQFTAQAFGDLDADGTFSTFERAGAGDQNGVNAAAGLYIDNELE